MSDLRTEETSPRARPPVFDGVAQAYADTRNALAAMPDMLLVGLISSCVYAGVDIMMGLDVTARSDPSTGLLLLTVLIGLVWNFFITPICIAVHRYIVLGEITPRYRLAPSEPRFMLFFGWTAFLTIAGILPGLFGLKPDSSAAINVVALLLMLLFLVASVRLLILFPAIAVDAPGARWQAAFADSQGNFWRIFAIVFFTLIPLMFAGLAFTAILGEDSRILKILWSLLAFFSSVLGVAVASRLYLILGQRLHGA